MNKTANIYIRPGARRLAGNTAWNLAGMCLPMVVALVAIPLLIKGLGNERFGLLGLVWMLVGYFSIFDLGLGRALTRMAAARLGAGRTTDLPRLFWTALLLMICLGVLLMAIIAAATPLLAGRLLKIPEHLHQETLRAFYIVALSMPIVITTTGLIGMLEAHQFFRAINCIRIPTGSFTFLGPLCVLPFSDQLPAIVGVLVIGRLVETIAYFLLCLWKIRTLRCRPRLWPGMIKPLAGFGGWLTVSNLAVPLMAHVDRFFVGAVVSVAAVAYYVTPAEIVIKLLIVPRAWSSVLFPAFSAGADHAGEEAGRLYSRGLRYLPALMFPAVLMIVVLAPEGLALWLNPDFALQSTSVMRWLAAGVFLAGLAYVPFAFLQGLGRPDIPARLHLAELIIYVLAAPWLVRRFGITGAAQAWFIRAAIDLGLMLWLTGRRAPSTRPAGRQLLVMSAVALAWLALAAQPAGLGTRLALAGAGMLPAVSLFWYCVLTAEERRQVPLMAGRIYKYTRRPEATTKISRPPSKVSSESRR